MNISTLAATLLAEDPLFASGSDDDKESAARALILRTGGKADEIYVHLVLAAVEEAAGAPAPALAPVIKPQAEAPVAPPPAPATKPQGAPEIPLLERFACATRLNDTKTAQLLGVSRPTVNLWRHGRSPERYTAANKKVLADTMRAQVAVLKSVLDRMGEPTDT